MRPHIFILQKTGFEVQFLEKLREESPGFRAEGFYINPGEIYEKITINRPFECKNAGWQSDLLQCFDLFQTLYFTTIISKIIFITFTRVITSLELMNY